MTIPLNRLYHFIENIAEKIHGDTVIIYRFYPHGSKNIEDLNVLYNKIYSWQERNKFLQVYCNDQEPLDYEFYSENLRNLDHNTFVNVLKSIGQHREHTNLNYSKNWFEKNYTEIFNKAKYFLSQHSKYSKCIIITCAGMGAKVLVSELHKLFPNNIYLDFGSALDFICTKHFIRRVKNYNESSIQALNAYKPPTGFKQLLPDGF